MSAKCCLLLLGIQKQAKIFKHNVTENSSKQVNLSESIDGLDKARKLKIQMS